MISGEPPKTPRPYTLPPPTLEELGILPPKERGVGYRVYRSICLTLLVILLVSCTGGYFWLKSLGVFHIDSTLTNTLQNFKARDNSVVYDIEGKKIGEFFERYQIYKTYQEIPRPLVQAILAIEDREFFNHPGVDIKAILRAAKASIQDTRFSQGASTITQQVARHIFLSKEKTVQRKVKEIVFALRMEHILSKERILEIYMNHMFLGYGAYGVGAAAHRLFGRPLAALKRHELALIAGLFQSPTRYNPHKYPKRARERQKRVLLSMYHANYLTKSELQQEINKPLVYTQYRSLNKQIAPYFIDYVRVETRNLIGKSAEGKGLRIYSTLDTKLQQQAQQAFEESQETFDQADSMIIENIRKPNREDKESVEAALLSIDPRNGQIGAMIGGRNYDESKYNRTWQATRQPGSAFKPIVYSLALQRGFNWSDMSFVSPVSINGYRPKNYSNSFLTETTLLRAFYLSLNTATVELGAKIGLDAIIEYAQKLGITSPLKKETGTMIGSSELTMMELARAYSVFANYGQRADPHSIIRITNRQGKVLYQHKENSQAPVITPQQAFLMTEGMRQVLAKGSGTKASHMASYAAGKTGTSNNAVDNWFAGYTRNLLTIVWLGSDDRQQLYGKASGGDLALPIWERFMSLAMASRKKERFWRPRGLTSSVVDPKYGNPSAQGVRMWFLAGQQPKKNSAAAEYKAVEGGVSYRSLFNH